MQEKLEKLLKNAYTPYSHFNVAAILVTNDNVEFSGVNVENASYGATICAERSAIVNAVSKGYTKGDFKELYVMNSSDKPVTPCFMCRQVLVEFFNSNSKVTCMSLSGEENIYTVSQLCPAPFTEEDLK